MGVGLSMAAMLFPVAIMENEASVNASVGMNICANGLAIAKTVFRHNALPNGSTFRDQPLPSVADQCYPVPSTPDPTGTGANNEDDYWMEDPSNANIYYPRTLKGFLVFAGEVTPGAGQNNYQLVIVSYAKTYQTYTIEADRANAIPTGAGNPLNIQTNVTTGEDEIQNPDDFPPVYLQPDRMVVFLNGQFARIASKTDKNDPSKIIYYFDRPVPTGGQDVWFVVEKDDTTPTPIVLTDSPCMSALANRTAVSD